MIRRESPRFEAVERVVALIAWIVLASWWMIPLAAIAALLWMIVDVVGQLLTGSETWERHPVQGGISDLLARLAWWPIDYLSFAVFGDGDLPLIPKERGS